MYQATCPQSLEDANRIVQQDGGIAQGAVQVMPEGIHQGVPGVRDAVLIEGLQEMVKGTLVLSELLARRKKRLNGGLQGKNSHADAQRQRRR